MARSGIAAKGMRRASLSPLVAVLIVLASCSSGSAPAAGPIVRVTEKDFAISAPLTPVPAGDVVLSVENQGPDDHELIVVRTDAPSLPLRGDGVTVDEESLDAATAGALEPGPPNDVRQLSIHLDPGHYALFCNMAGHYLGGMYADLDVTA